MMSNQDPTENISGDSYSIVKLAVILFTDMEGFTVVTGKI
jgi:hypothetical protein